MEVIINDGNEDSICYTDSHVTEKEKLIKIQKYNIRKLFFIARFLKSPQRKTDPKLFIEIEIKIRKTKQKIAEEIQILLK